MYDCCIRNARDSIEILLAVVSTSTQTNTHTHTHACKHKHICAKHTRIRETIISISEEYKLKSGGNVKEKRKNKPFRAALKK